MANWTPISGIKPPIPIRDFAGVYKPDDEGFNLADNVFTELINFCPDKYPAITTKPGYSVIGTFGTRVLGLGAWKDSELHAVFNDGSWRRLNNDGTWTSLATGLNTSADWSFCNFKGNLTEINLIGANGTDAIKRYNGSTVQNLTNAPSGGNYITTQANRLYCAKENSVLFCALNKPTDWSTVDDAGEIGYQTTNGETINGLNAGYQHVTAYKPSSMSELYGTGPSNYSFPVAGSDIGATGNKAVTVKDDVQFFVSRDGIFRYDGGIRPTKDYSVAVYNFARAMNPAQLAKCVAESDGRYLYFAIPYGSATESTTLLQYDPMHGAWYTWDGVSITQMLRVGSKFYIGDASGRVLLLGGTTAAGSAITSTAITKPFALDSIARKQEWYKLWIVASVPAGSTLQVYASGKAAGNDWTLVNSLTAASEIQYKELLIPTTSLRGANAVRLKIVGTGPVTIHELTRQVRELPMRR
ncbi:hypothetical protein [Cohnella panacarvi]|uniref:hypothetical protein n=1 Tax=Cohnella panacarvi TaxID=400776 RepID=UPI00047C30DF|nr:hypothetical protein [Cohnella panacarvi]